MKEPKVSKAMAYLDEDLISDAVAYQPKEAKYPAWTKWAAVAACLCLILSAAVLFPHLGGQGSAPQPGALTLSEKTTAKVSYGYDEGNVVLSKADLIYLTEEEMFAQKKMYIFRGTVSALTNVTIDFGGEKEARCVATIEVEKVYQGALSEGDQIQMLLPCPIAEDGIWIEDTGVVSGLKAGMKGIFMPWVYDENSRLEQNGAVLMEADLAQCGLADGVRWVFLDTGRGLAFERNAYPGAATAETLDDIEEYVLEKLK